MNRSSCSLLLLISLFTLLFLVFIHPVNCLSCDTVSSIADLQTSAANPSITAICITAGTYSLPSELVFVRSTNLMLIGLGSLASDTIFIASGSFRVMSLNSTAAIAFSIQKITFQNGSPNIGPGGCLRVAGSTGTTLSIDSSNFQNCIAPSLGGGIAMLSITAVANITNTAFWNNQAAGNGGGLYIISTNTVKMSNCTFYNNTAQYGGGYYVFQYSKVSISSTHFQNNSASFDGGGLYLGPAVTFNISDSTFVGNYGNYGGGLNIETSGTLSQGGIVNTNFTGNTIASLNWGSAANVQSAIVYFRNCYFTNNIRASVSLSYNSGAIQLLYDDTKVAIVNCVFSGNTRAGEYDAVISSIGNNPGLVQYNSGNPSVLLESGSTGTNNKLAFNAFCTYCSTTLPFFYNALPECLIPSTTSVSTNTISINTLSTNTISTRTVSTNTISTNTISTNTISTNTISTNTISTNTISTNTLSTNKLSINTISTNTISTNTISTNTISTNTLSTNTLSTNTISTNTISTNTVATPTSTPIFLSSTSSLVSSSTGTVTAVANGGGGNASASSVPVGPIVAAAAVSLTLVAFTVFIVCIRIKRKTGQRLASVSPQTEELELTGIGSRTSVGTELVTASTKSPGYEEIGDGATPQKQDEVLYESLYKNVDGTTESIRGALVQGELLGSGQFGEVHSGTLAREFVPLFCSDLLVDSTSDLRVAIKSMKPNIDQKSAKDFIEEAHMMSLFRHPNIIRSVAALLEKTPNLLVLEYLAYGDLKKLLQTAKKLDLTLKEPERLYIIQQIAAGLEYLESIRIVHRDLAARNCLVGDNLTVKISDFGLGRLIGDESDYYRMQSKGKLPIKWMAPENFNYRKYTSASDIWSFGVVAWEVYSNGESPSYGSVTVQEIPGLLESGVRLPCPEGCPLNIYSHLITVCWKWDAQARPSAGDCKAFINNIISINYSEFVPRNIGKLISEKEKAKV